MAEKPYQLLVIDIDGTLINRQGAISDKDTEALKKAIGSGITVAISTGRVAQASRWVLTSLSLDGYHIFSDGALVANLDTGDEPYIEPLEKDMVKHLVDLSRDTHLHFDLYSSKQFFIEHDDWTTEIRRQFFRLTPTIVSFDKIWQNENIIKGTLIVRSEEEKATARNLQSCFDGNLSFSWTNTPHFPDIEFINVISPTVSKGKALLKLCSFLNIPRARTMAIGDGPNDMSLLSTAGLAVAMGNAKQGLKDIAHYTTLDVEESGVAAAIEKFLL